MISKELFVKSINTLRDEWDFSNEISELNKKYGKENYFEYHPFTLLDLGMELLGSCFLPTTEHFLEWWCLEKDFGRTFKIGDVSYKENGIKVEVDLSTAEKVYDFLISCVEEENKEA